MRGIAGRIPAIDGLRAVAVALVFASHAYPKYFPGGFVGVDIFFVISGYVITRSLIADGLDLRRFYLHRFLRIVPPILPVLAAVILSIALGSTYTRPIDVLAAGASFMNMLRAADISHGGTLGHFWSLSVEEQFYLLWPALFLLVGKRQAAIGALMIALFAWQVGLYLMTGDADRVYNGLDTRGAQLLVGCLLAVWNPRGRSWWLVAPLAALGPFILLVRFDSAFYLTFGMPLAALGAALTIAVLAGPQTVAHTILQSKPLQWTGSRSYALYLWHYPLLIWGFAAMPDGWPALVAVSSALIGSLLAAELSYRLIERPARNLRERFAR
jgi:peptidoglycan/LPS O-acetylase OafA/YrhL